MTVTATSTHDLQPTRAARRETGPQHRTRPTPTHPTPTRAVPLTPSKPANHPSQCISHSTSCLIGASNL